MQDDGTQQEEPGSLSATPGTAAPSGGRRRNNVNRSSRSYSRKKMQNRYGYLFMTPWLLGFFLLTLGPMLISFYLSFTDYDIFTTPQWIGLSNYARMFFHDPRYKKALGLTLFYVMLGVPGQLGVALIVSLLLSQKRRGLGIYRAVYYLPSLVASSVAIAIVWRRVFSADGVLNMVLAVVGIQGPAWISHPDFTIYTLIAHRLWMFGTPMVIFIARLLQIPGYLYESAKIDGAGRMRTFFKITLPMLTPILFLNMVMQMIYALRAFTPAYILSHGTGGPLDSMLFYTLYLYQEAFTYLRMGYASSMAWVLLIMTAALTGGLFLSSRHWVYYEDQ